MQKDFLFEALSGILSTSSYAIKPLKVVFSLYLQGKIRTIYLKYMEKKLTSSSDFYYNPQLTALIAKNIDFPARFPMDFSCNLFFYFERNHHLHITSFKEKS